MRLSEASQRYLATRTQEGFSPHTIRAYRLQHQILIREVGDVRHSSLFGSLAASPHIRFLGPHRNWQS